MNGVAPVLNSSSHVAGSVADQEFATPVEYDTGLAESLVGKASRLTIRPVSSVSSAPLRSRRITPQAGRALEILGHAIDYLIDEWVLAEGANLSPNGPQAEAIYLLMRSNREIYDCCPPVFTIAERLESALLRFLGFKAKTEDPGQAKEVNSSPIYPKRY
jgi:hypothetical protein